MSAVNVHEQTARAAKVNAVVAVLDRAKNKAGDNDAAALALLLDLSENGWGLVERAAQVHPLSEESRMAVVRRFENRLRAASEGVTPNRQTPRAAIPVKNPKTQSPRAAPAQQEPR